MTAADDLLKRALDCWDFNDDPYFDDVNGIMQEIRAYLDAPMDEPKPVAWMYRDGALGHYDHGEATRPLYLHPPTKTVPKDEPMTDEEMAFGFTEPRHSQWQAFVAGVRFAERHHLAGGDK